MRLIQRSDLARPYHQVGPPYSPTAFPKTPPRVWRRRLTKICHLRRTRATLFFILRSKLLIYFHFANHTLTEDTNPFNARRRGTKSFFVYARDKNEKQHGRWYEYIPTQGFVLSPASGQKEPRKRSASHSSSLSTSRGISETQSGRYHTECQEQASHTQHGQVNRRSAFGA